MEFFYKSFGKVEQTKKFLFGTQGMQMSSKFFAKHFIHFFDQVLEIQLEFKSILTVCDIRASHPRLQSVSQQGPSGHSGYSYGKVELEWQNVGKW